MDETYDVVVVGGGLAGLTAAAVAAEGGCSVLLLDSNDRGGRAATDEVGRFRFNRGGHALYRSGPGRQVLDRLGVPVRGEPPVLGGSQARLGDRVGLLPVDAMALTRTKLLGTKDKLTAGKLLNGVRRWRPERLADRSVAQWFDELGLQGAVRHVAEGYVRLTSFIADFDRASADVAATQIQGVVGGGVDYLHGGWVTLVDGLRSAAQQRGARLEPKAGVRRVVPDGTRAEVQLDGRAVAARRVVLAAGSPEAAAALLPESPAAWRELGPPARVACLDLGLPAEPPTAPLLLGLDWPLYLNRHAPPADLAPAGAAVEHALLYLRPDEDPSPDEARAAMVEHCRLGGVDPDQAEEVRYLHRMVASSALPQPETGGMRGRPGVDTGLDGVLVAGDWVGPIGHLADAALASGEAAGRLAVEQIDHEPLAKSFGGPTAVT